jgi:hypothetical protein
VRELVLRQEPYGLSPPRPEPRPLSHPAQRDVDDRTAFLIRPRRLV